MCKWRHMLVHQYCNHVPGWRKDCSDSVAIKACVHQYCDHVPGWREDCSDSVAIKACILRNEHQIQKRANKVSWRLVGTEPCLDPVTSFLYPHRRMSCSHCVHISHYMLACESQHEHNIGYLPIATYDHIRPAFVSCRRWGTARFGLTKTFSIVVQLLPWLA